MLGLTRVAVLSHSMFRSIPVALAILVCFVSHSSLATVVAEKISIANADTSLQQGPDAISGLGDWHLSNGTICVNFSDIAHESDMSTTGGVPIDIGFCDRDDDHFISMHDLLDGKQSAVVDIQSVAVGVEREVAYLIADGERNGLKLFVRYELNPALPTQLKITKRFERVAASEEKTRFLTPLLFNYHSLDPFILSLREPSASRGFRGENVSRRGVSSLRTAAVNADVIIVPGEADSDYPIAYGWRLESAQKLADGKTYSLPSFVIADDEASLMMVPVDEFWMGSGRRIGYLQLLQLNFMSLDIGDAIELEEIIYVADDTDVASISNQLFAADTNLISQIDEEGTALHVELLDGTPVTFLRPKASRPFSVNLPPGEYRLRLRGVGGRESISRAKIVAGVNRLEIAALPPIANVRLPKYPMRLVFVGVDGTATPNFVESLNDATVEDESGLRSSKPVNSVFLAGVPSDPQTVKLPSGEYKVYATRGPEYSVETVRLSIPAATPTILKIPPPKRQIETRGWIAADFHVHSGHSFDNTFSPRERVRTFVAESGEIMVASDHDYPFDYQPIIEELGVTEHITSMIGVEVTSNVATAALPHTSGHSNFFPFIAEPQSYRRGVPNHENKRLREIIDTMKRNNADGLFQLNHPRAKLTDNLDRESTQIDSRYFEHLGPVNQPFDPDALLSDAPNTILLEPDHVSGTRDIDFDLLEVLNPSGDPSLLLSRMVRRDWLSFVLQGQKIYATANSDSHATHEQVAVPRTMIAVSSDDVREFDRHEFLQSLRSGNAYGTTGPMIEVRLGDKGIGGTFRGKEATFSLTLKTADWVAIDRVSLQINGRQIESIDIAKGERKLQRQLRFEKDSVLTIEVFGEPGEKYAAVYPHLSPYAFSNPIYIDANGDGHWEPPGLSTFESLLY